MRPAFTPRDSTGYAADARATSARTKKAKPNLRISIPGFPTRQLANYPEAGNNIVRPAKRSRKRLEAFGQNKRPI
jgi:hypothetical protein